MVCIFPKMNIFIICHINNNIFLLHVQIICYRLNIFYEKIYILTRVIFMHFRFFLLYYIIALNVNNFNDQSLGQMVNRP